MTLLFFQLVLSLWATRCRLFVVWLTMTVLLSSAFAGLTEASTFLTAVSSCCRRMTPEKSWSVGQSFVMSSLLQSIHSVHSGYLYSASSRMLCQSSMPKCHRQLWVNDLPEVPTWRPERILTRDLSDERRRIYEWASLPQASHTQLWNSSGCVGSC